MVTGATFSTNQSLSTPAQTMCMCGIPYAEATGSVLWPVIVLQLNAAFAALLFSQFIQNPAHWETLMHITVHLGLTKDLWSTFVGCTETLQKVTAIWTGEAKSTVT